jgi:hypothetical protein
MNIAFSNAPDVRTITRPFDRCERHQDAGNDNMTGQSMYFYRLCGINLASEMRLPELEPQLSPDQLGADFQPDVEFVFGQVEALAEPSHTIRNYQLHGDAAFLWNVKDYGRYLVTGGSRITVQPDPAASELAIRAVLIGPIQSILWYQRRHLALHASAVLRGGAAICVSGKSGAGKSVLTALLAERGLPVLADDICVLSPADDDIRLLPGYASLRLWDDVSDHIPGLRKCEPAHIGGKKSLVSFGEAEPLSPSAAISDLVLLTERGPDFAVARCNEFQLLQHWSELAHLPMAARAMGRMQQIVRQLHGLIAGGTRVWSVTLPNNIPATRAAIDPLLSALDGA